MPPKPKFTKEDIVKVSLEIISEKGVEALTAREIGKRLNSSARPIFTLFANMEELQDFVRDAAMKKFEDSFTNSKDDIPLFKKVGMHMVLFGLHEPKLYQYLFMNENEKAVNFDEVFGELGELANICISAVEKDYGLKYDDAKFLFENVWVYTFGIGALCATNVCKFTEERLNEMLSIQFTAIMKLIKEGK